MHAHSHSGKHHNHNMNNKGVIDLDGSLTVEKVWEMVNVDLGFGEDYREDV